MVLAHGGERFCWTELGGCKHMLDFFLAHVFADKIQCKPLYICMALTPMLSAVETSYAHRLFMIDMEV